MSTFEYPFDLLQPPPPPVVPADAGTLVAEARAEADAIREAARAEGFALGRQAAQEALAPALAALAEAEQQVREAALAAAEELEADAVELAFAVAEKVLAAHVGVHHALVLDAVHGALRGLVERDQVTVLVHPDDLELVRAAGDELRARLGGIERWDVQAERRVARGGAVVRHAHGLIDASHAAKLARARDIVHEQLLGPAS